MSAESLCDWYLYLRWGKSPFMFLTRLALPYYTEKVFHFFIIAVGLYGYLLTSLNTGHLYLEHKKRKYPEKVFQSERGRRAGLEMPIYST